eukprot:CAMPEP_0196667668 /NCGR_PEP_ID=MMETSP1086-20130531/65206_1 /TAXON_ID=77921 /ORGANISM="Cyanoptyche  gloeocystis , Strain SAG4.97" /LENGTH=261 /DNA_ID=CAMNT_0042005019 /DNA_START=59 /DNA_END=844 /DNA_ORIENTATION=+
MPVAAGCTLLPPGFSLGGSNTVSPYRPLAIDLAASYTRTISAECDPEDDACLQASCASYGNYVHTDSFIDYDDLFPLARQFEVDALGKALLDERAVACTLLPEAYTTAFHPEDRKLFITPSRPAVEELQGRPSAAMVVERVEGKGIPYFACATYGVPAGKYVRPGKIDKYVRIPYFACATYGVPAGHYVRPEKIDKYVPSEAPTGRVDSAVQVVAETIQAEEIDSFPSLESYTCDYVDDFSEYAAEDAFSFDESAHFVSLV